MNSDPPSRRRPWRYSRIIVAARVALSATARGGFQIIKEKQVHRIDIVVAMAMAAYACVHRGHVEPVKIVPANIYSKNQGWWGDAVGNSGTRSTTQKYFYYVNSGGFGGWPGSPGTCDW